MLHERTPSGVRFVLWRRLALPQRRYALPCRNSPTSTVSNPFAPPRSDVADIVDVARKPKSVWLMQIVEILLACVFGLGLLKGTLSLLSGSSMSSLGFLAHCVFDVVVLWALVHATVASQKRRPLGRLLGLLLIAAIFAMFVYVAYINLRYSVVPPEASVEYRTGHAIGQIFSIVLMLCACAFWFRSFGFSRPARTWFGVATDPARLAPDEWHR